MRRGCFGVGSLRELTGEQTMNSQLKHLKTYNSQLQRIRSAPVEYAAEYFTKGVLHAICGDLHMVLVFTEGIVTYWLRDVNEVLSSKFKV